MSFNENIIIVPILFSKFYYDKTKTIECVIVKFNDNDHPISMETINLNELKDNIPYGYKCIISISDGNITIPLKFEKGMLDEIESEN